MGNFPLLFLLPMTSMPSEGLGSVLSLGTGYLRGFQTWQFASHPPLPPPEWGCGYYCSSRPAQGTLLFAALCPGATHKALPCLASRLPGSVDERHCSHLRRLECSLCKPGDVETNASASQSLMMNGGSLESTLSLASLKGQASSEMVLGQLGVGVSRPSAQGCPNTCSSFSGQSLRPVSTLILSSLLEPSTALKPSPSTPVLTSSLLLNSDSCTVSTFLPSYPKHLCTTCQACS